MLGHVGRGGPARRLREAVDRTLREDRVRTPDLGGGASTDDLAKAIAHRVRETA
jgi:isocitrate dehydrogenase (NAD+)